MRRLYIKQRIFKITDHYNIKDDQGQVCYRVDEDFKFFGHKVKVSDPQGQPLFEISRKLFKIFSEYQIKFVDGSQVTIKDRLSFFRRKVKISSPDYNLDLKGNFLDNNFALTLDGEKIGSINHKIFAIRDTFVLDVYNEDYEAVMVGLAIALDNMMDNEEAAD
ncbi:LURP-one-related/scramblase family protein [Aerococcus urinae]|uniref:LURP-one-related family protein n=1 Tax=Aerococcus urinae TaxID=1376 RepID=A0A0X8FEW3_9LACT|nr:LURP-one-related family protein [Aerococcus urinae]AMB95940.1 hypothetical protein AWM73_05200 [Aerococcus urinae]MCY3032528.1 LURP-one-related family protein [Aerococcus urinae]MCY3044574.1 LURP-one-related family protein [Aerococcus urinae]MCY3046992.1 LURP-one-related family protein [Aerococcus urinae]MCY3048029.1 LURP-one-related family protein [Aerococcus urinae]